MSEVEMLRHCAWNVIAHEMAEAPVSVDVVVVREKDTEIAKTLSEPTHKKKLIRIDLSNADEGVTKVEEELKTPGLPN